MPLYYEDVAVRNTGSSDLSGTTRVRDVVSVALVSIFLVTSTNNAVAVTDNVQASLSNWGIRSTFDAVNVSNLGSTNLSGVNKVREFVQVNMSGSGPVNLSSARVDVCLVSENVSRTLTPIRISLSDITYVRESPGQDSPVIVRESIVVSLSGAQNITLVVDNIGVLESRNNAYYTAALARFISDVTSIREYSRSSIPSTDTAYVRENVNISLHNQLMATSVNESNSVTESVVKLITPIHPATQGDSVIVTDYPLGFLSAHEPGTRVIVEPVGVSENIIRKHSHIEVLVFDIIGVQDIRSRDTRGYWYRYLSRYRG